MIFLWHHLHQALKMEYLTIKDPYVLWSSLYERYGHLKSVILPNARNEWNALRLQDFKSVHEYNSALYRITSQLKLCGENITDEDMLEETFTTFHASNMVLQQQYKAHQYTKYSDLIACLLVAKKNNELLMKNHQAHPTGTKPIFEANAVSHDHEDNYENGRGRGHNRGRRHSRGHGRGYYRGRRYNKNHYY